MRVESEDQPLTKEEVTEETPLAKEQQAEDEPRDPHLDGIERHDSLWATWFLLFRNFIGISSLGVATYFQEVGITWSVFILAGATLLCYYGNSLFCKAADKTNFRDKRMESLMGLHFGEAGYIVCATVVLIVQSCLFINTFIIYAEYIQETVCDDLQWSSICFKRWQWLMLFFAIEAPLIAFVKQMNFFTYLALPSCISLISLYLINIVYGLMYIEDNGVSETVNVGSSSLMSKILFFGGLSFIIEGVTNLIPIRSTMVRPFLFPKLMRWALVGIFILICALGMIIPLALGDDTPDLIMLAFQSDHMWTIIPNLIFVLSSIFFKPIDLMIIFFFIEENTYYRRAMEKFSPTQQSVITKCLKVLLAFCLVGTGTFFESFADFMEYAGSFFFPFVNFVFPIFLYLKVFNSLSITIKVMNYIICAFGFTVCFMAVLDDIGLI